MRMGVLGSKVIKEVLLDETLRWVSIHLYSNFIIFLFYFILFYLFFIYLFIYLYIYLFFFLQVQQ